MNTSAYHYCLRLDSQQHGSNNNWRTAMCSLWWKREKTTNAHNWQHNVINFVNKLVTPVATLSTAAHPSVCHLQTSDKQRQPYCIGVVTSLPHFAAGQLVLKDEVALLSPQCFVGQLVNCVWRWVSLAVIANRWDIDGDLMPGSADRPFVCPPIRLPVALISCQVCCCQSVRHLPL